MKLGAEPKKVAILVVLTAAAGFLFYQNTQEGGETKVTFTGAAEAPPASAAPASPASPGASPGRRIARRGRERGESFSPKIGFDRGEERPDLNRIDPTLRFDLLAKVQAIERGSGGRNLFQFSTPPPPPPPPAPKVTIKPGSPGQVAQAGGNGQPDQPGSPAKPVKPPPPPIPLKFYGFSEPRGPGAKRAFFLEGEDIFVAAEGELIKKRYKVIRISGNAVVMEDVEHKHQQTIQIQQDVQG